jgi:glycosyltransferase involved in cell wall biosynthesis
VKLKILHVNTSDINGGAAIAAHRLHKALLKNNIDSKMLVMKKASNEKEVVLARNNNFEKHIFSKIRVLFKKIILSRYKNRKDIIFSPAKFGLDITKNKIIQEADVIHLHWVVGNFLSLNSLDKLFSLNKKIVWTLHDMWAFTGGCHYSDECEKYKHACYDCPILNSNKEKDLSRKVFEKKSKIYQGRDINIITCSEWLGECAKQSKLLKNKNINSIPNVLDNNIFKNIDQNIARDILSLDKNKKYILFGAMNSTSDPRKGWDYLKNSIKIINERYADVKGDVELLVFGSSYSKDVEKTTLSVKFLGRFFDEIALSLIYNSADLFVAPSLEDNLPNTVLESLHCGTPVVAFNIGGMPDMIEHEKNGYLAKCKDSKDLANGIIWSLNNLKNVNLINEEFKKKTILNNILDLYTN